MLRIYLLLLVGWVALTAAGFLVKRRGARRFLLRLSYVVLILFCVEAACVLAFYIKNGRWTFDDQREYLSRLYEPHPYLVAAPRPGARVAFRGISYTHNARGLRGPEVGPKSERLRVVAVGGSTTYGAGVTDGREWPARLGELLGPRYEVLNFGMLGHSTAEHLALLSLVVPEYRPDLLVIHAGYNDMRNMHVRGLAADYSDYHAPSLYASFNLCADGPAQKFASGRVAVWALRRAGLYPECAFSRPVPPADDSPEAEARALGLYRRNLETLVTIAAGQGLKPVLVPQLLDRENVRGGRLRWWIPHVDDAALVDFLARYNAVTEEVAARRGLRYAREVLEHPWSKADFADAVHLNPDASLRFAGIMRGVIENLREEEYKRVDSRQ
ncbi:MAG TPA: GDSL-type esterase/lipase family protein [Pyrinomonadaceae bacterium]|nr:GDSL-type esterase/lipase family protein [Pyrinomonadaceae bacterium]